MLIPGYRGPKMMTRKIYIDVKHWSMKKITMLPRQILQKFQIPGLVSVYGYSL